MSLINDLKSEVNKILAEKWELREGSKVPESTDLKLSNDAVTIEGVILYADINGSTSMVDKFKPHFSAEIYKIYLSTAARLIKHNEGVITAYDGDRIMAVFIGNSKRTNAIKSGLMLNTAVGEILNPQIKIQYQNTSFNLKHCVGIDICNLFIARTGVRGANDLVWVGRAANHAAKLTELSLSDSVRVTKECYEDAHLEVKQTSSGSNIWNPSRWTEMDRQIYSTNGGYNIP